VNEQLRLLVELQRLDTTILADSRTIEDIPNRISIMEKPLKAAESALESAKKKFDAFEKKKRDRELEVEESNERIQKLRDRTNDIKDNKAYQAHLKEIDTLEKKTFALEDEVLDAMEALEGEASKVKEAEEALAVEKKKADELRRELDAEVEKARAELDELKNKRGELTSGLDPENYENYMSLLGITHGVAVTRVEGEVCAGCNMNIMPQLYVEIKKNTEIIQCPQCRRILYHEPDSDTAPDEGASTSP
jgi:predicted  nucleic acid-binding Zn-ribbon protein